MANQPHLRMPVYTDREELVVMMRHHAALVQDVLTAYHRYFAVLHRRTLSALLEFDLTLRQLQAMVFLAYCDTACISTIARQLGLGRPTVSLLVDNLVQLGLVSRCEDPADRRRAVVRLTAQGVDGIDALLQGGQGDLHPALMVMETTDLLALYRGLQALTALASAQGAMRQAGAMLQRRKDPRRSVRCT
jgi:DNA-binding MarR family transcriptional regulator